MPESRNGRGSANPNTARLNKHIVALERGDDLARREAVHHLARVEAQDWARVPRPRLQAAVVSLRRHLADNTNPPYIRREAATILGDMAPFSQSAVAHLTRLLEDESAASIRETVVIALGKFGEGARDAVGPLLQLVPGQDGLAMHALRALGSIGCADRRVRSTLQALWLGAAQTQSGLIAIAQTLCMLKVEANGLLPFLTRHAVASLDDSVRKFAVEALAHCSKTDLDVVPALLAVALGDKNEHVRQFASVSLEQLQAPPQKAVFICAAQLGESSFAEIALRRAGALAVPALRKALGASAAATRVKAANVLAVLGELAVRAVPELRESLRDRNTDVRLAAVKAMWNITTSADDVVHVLINLLEGKPPRERDVEERRRFLQTVIEALWRIGPPAAAAVPALVAKRKDSNRLIRESADVAIKRILPSFDDK